MPKKMGNGEECLHRFGQHCRAFYDSSLILQASSSSLSSMQEEKKSDENHNDGYDLKKKEASDGKIVLETLDRISAICSMVVGTQHQPNQHNISSQLQDSIASLRQEHTLTVERHHVLLLECGLLDVDRFMKPSCSKNEDAAVCSLQNYVQMRDAMRRLAHKMSMLHRQNSVFDLLSQSDVTDTHPSKSPKPRMTQRENVRNTLFIIKKFVKRYQSNIGSHPFLAGLYRIVDLQLNPKSGGGRRQSYIVRWKFRGSVLTEACRSCHGKDNENADDELAYAREAVQVMFSFLIWVKDIDVEGGGLMAMEEADLEDISSRQDDNSPPEEREPTLSFEIDKHISNANLRRILAALPNPKHLDARATGYVEELHSSLGDSKIAKSVADSNLVPRKNVDGHQDEQWPWFARWDFCTVL